MPIDIEAICRLLERHVHVPVKALFTHDIRSEKQVMPKQFGLVVQGQYGLITHADAQQKKLVVQWNHGLPATEHWSGTALYTASNMEQYLHQGSADLLSEPNLRNV
jgi:hypothetical protein